MTEKAMAVRRPGFESPFPVAVSQVSPAEWELTAPLIYHATQALMSQNVGLLRRWSIWAGVRLGALTRPGGWHQWWRDAPAVIGISLAMLPVALLPTPLGLALFNLAEWIVSPLGPAPPPPAGGGGLVTIY